MMRRSPPTCGRPQGSARLMAAAAAAFSAAWGGWLPVRAGASDVPDIGRSGAAARGASKQLGVFVQPTRVFLGAVPRGWEDPTFNDEDWQLGPGLLVPRGAFRPENPAPVGVTPIEAPPGGAVYLRIRFDVESPGAARLLELRVTYKDGFVAYLNGAELARRNLPESPADARPAVAHGGDAERIFVPVSPGGVTLLARNNVLAVEIRPAQGRPSPDVNAPSGEVAIAAVTSGVRIVRGPYLVAPTDGGISVAWETDLPARGKVVFRSQADRRELTVAAPKLERRQVVRLRGLSPGDDHRYRVEVAGAAAGDAASSPEAAFQAAPARDAPARFIVYGDMRAPGHSAHAQVVAGILNEKPSLIVNTGDLVANGAEESAWQRYFEITSAMGATTPIAPALGNHEAYRGGAPASWALFGLKSAGKVPGDGHTSFDWGGLHFVILDTNNLNARQRAWLGRDLTAARSRRARAIFALCHEGPWSHGPHGGSRTFERDFAPLLARAGVDVLFSGHDHLYERGTGITPNGPLPYVVTGGGGAPLYAPTCQPLGQTSSVLPPPSAATRSPAGGAAGARSATPLPLPACPPSVATIVKRHHYVVVEVGPGMIRLCPRFPDNTPVEPCTELPLRARRR